MIDRSNEIIKDLTRLANDRNLQPRVRNKITNAIQHIKDLHDGVSRIRDLHLKLNKSRSHIKTQTNVATESGRDIDVEICCQAVLIHPEDSIDIKFADAE